jgi:hypothetical protein
MAMARLGVALHPRHPPSNLKGVAKEATENKPTVFHSNHTTLSSGPTNVQQGQPLGRPSRKLGKLAGHVAAA